MLLFARTDVMREQLGHQHLPIEQASVARDLEVVHSNLDDSALASLVAEGRTRSVDNAVTIALEG